MSPLTSTRLSNSPIVRLETVLHPAAVATTQSRKVTEGDVLLQGAMAGLYNVNRDPSSSYDWELKTLNEAAITHQHPIAITLLGKIHEQGKFGVSQNYELAAAFYKKASHLEVGEASYRYGQLCFEGHVPGQDVVTAWRYVELASQQNYQHPKPAVRDSEKLGETGPARNRFTGPSFAKLRS